MAATVLTSQHYDGVRGLIAPDVTAEHISDDLSVATPVRAGSRTQGT